LKAPFLETFRPPYTARWRLCRWILFSLAITVQPGSLAVVATEGKEGKLSPAVYIQRLQTEGEKAPAELPKRVGTKVGVEYKAAYFFYGPAK